MAKSKRCNNVPVVMRTSEMGSTENGCGCCGFCRICTCLKWNFFTTPTGILKSTQSVLSCVCQVLCLQYGAKYGSELGFAFAAFLNASAGSFFTSTILLICYVCSEINFARIRPTYFEVLLNLVLFLTFITSGLTLVYSVHNNLFYYFNTIPGFQTYPAMTVTYMFGFILSVLHGIDAVLAFRALRSIQ